MSTPFLPIADIEANHENQRFWDALHAGRIELPYCESCRTFVWYPRAICPSCHADVADWKVLPGTGHVYSYTIVAKGTGRWKDAGPYVAAYVQLDSGIDGVEGPRILTNVVGDGVQQKINVDSHVRAFFERDRNKDDIERVLLRFVLS